MKRGNLLNLAALICLPALAVLAILLSLGAAAPVAAAELGPHLDPGAGAPATPPHRPLLQDSPALTITKTANPNPAVAGGSLVYTIQVSGDPISDVTNLVITDALDSHVTFGSASDGGSESGGVVTWNVLTLGAGQAVTRVVTVTVGNVSGDTILSNTAGVTSTEGATASVTINTEVNAAPTNITLSNNSVAENQPVGTTVGTFSTTDSDTGDTHIYTLVAGTGDDDNGSFTVVGNILQTNAVFDYNTKSSYKIRVRTTDSGGLIYEKAFTVSVTDLLPTISVSKTPNPTSVPESGSTVTFTVLVTNTSAESVTLNSLTDTDFGSLAGQGTCTLPQNLAANNGTYSCSFSRTISGNFGGPAHQNTVTASATDNESNTATNTGTATVTFTDVPSSIQVTKTANPTAVNEPSGSVSYTVIVTNTSTVDDVTITTITDNRFGNPCSSVLPAALAENESVTCTFTRTVSGQPATPHTNTVTASGTDDDGLLVSDNDSTTVTFNNLPPVIFVTVNANPSSVPETGGNVTFNIQVLNFSLSSGDVVTITNLTDDILGNLNGRGNCSLPQAITPGNTYPCSFSTFVDGDAGSPEIHTVSASGTDEENSLASNSAQTTVSFTNVNPNITVTKTANPISVPENGGNVTFTIFVSNTINEAATLNVLTDTVFVNLNGRGTCTLPQPLSAYGSYTCSFTEFISGNASGPAHVNTVTARATDDENNSDDATDDATVSFTNVQPTITVTKSANPAAVTEPGGNVIFTVSVRNNSTFETVTLNSLSDNIFGNLNGKGCVVGGTITPNGGTYSCSFTEFIAGNSGDPAHVNTVTAAVTDDDGSNVQGQGNATVFFGELKRVYLPLLFKAPPTSLYVRNLTGGLVTFTVIGTGVNNCSIDAGTTKFCGSFTSGTYNVYVTSICGPPQTFSYTYPPGEWTNEVFCN
ncbi:MAG: cadherin domain-containing protein [Chloroflexota bacterium]